jgi:hypothetical protein
MFQTCNVLNLSVRPSQGSDASKDNPRQTVLSPAENHGASQSYHEHQKNRERVEAPDGSLKILKFCGSVASVHVLDVSPYASPIVEAYRATSFPVSLLHCLLHLRIRGSDLGP